MGGTVVMHNVCSCPRVFFEGFSALISRVQLPTDAAGGREIVHARML